MAKIKVLSKEITIQTRHEEDYISLTDIARYKDAERTDYIIQNWLRNRNTIEFLGIWEHLNNPGFNPIEFDGIKKKAGLNSFILTAKRWIEATNAIGLISKTGRYGGTYAHKDSLLPGFQSNSNSISSRNFSASRTRNSSNWAGISGAIWPRSTTGFTPTRLRRTLYRRN
jgi:hypothetical protein